MAAPTDSIKISAMTDGVAAQAGDLVPARRGAGNVWLSLTYIKNLVLSGLTLAWGSITGTPTTLAGYGIADAAPLSHVGSGGAQHANVVAAGAAGFMTGTDKTKLDGIASGAQIGTVTSVAMTVPSDMSIGGSPITGAGTLAITRNTQNANLVQAGPVSGAAATPAFRSLIPADLPQANAIASLYEDFIGGVSGVFTSSANGTGATNTTAIDSGGHPGILQAQTGTSAAGSAGVGLGGTVNLASIRLANGAWVCETDIRIPTASDGTNTFTTFLGFNDSRAGNGVDSVMFRYTHGTNSGKFEAVTRANSVETATDTGITMTANQWYKLRIEINAAATSVGFFIDGVLVATNTTNIPTGAGRETGVFLGIVQSLGATSRSLDIDYALYICTLTTPR